MATRDIGKFGAFGQQCEPRGLVAGGFGYSLLSTKPVATMSYDGNALVTRLLAD
ncbi:hypothetical protein [Nordella sp. HKS 07]|uniref:hypothetical protein n=1 Tax=Nordella sp. HKS 07 TaxID=2712222 RepID=UPI001FEF552A|nr:hypothetical protein [Nordella sp. HKS 07]